MHESGNGLPQGKKLLQEPDYQILEYSRGLLTLNKEVE